MSDEKKSLKFQMMMSPQEAERLDDWMFQNRLRSRAEAIRQLCQIGIIADEYVEKLNVAARDMLEASHEFGKSVDPFLGKYLATDRKRVEEIASGRVDLGTAQLALSKVIQDFTAELERQAVGVELAELIKQEKEFRSKLLDDADPKD